MDCSRQGSSVHGFLQARILEWVAIPLSRGFLLVWKQICPMLLEGDIISSFQRLFAEHERLVSEMQKCQNLFPT